MKPHPVYSKTQREANKNPKIPNKHIDSPDPVVQRQFDELTKSKEPIGRTLDFLAQEINREVNTIGSKANDSLISREVVTLKAELEKFREQAMNVE